MAMEKGEVPASPIDSPLLVFGYFLVVVEHQHADLGRLDSHLFRYLLPDFVVVVFDCVEAAVLLATVLGYLDL
jgi:hypothetical protein